MGTTYTKERVTSLINELYKEASKSEAELSPEQKFKLDLEKSASAENHLSEDVIKQISEGVIDYLKNEENMLNKTAGVNMPTVSGAAAVHEAPADEPTLGKTQTTTNELPKGYTTPEKNQMVASIIAQLTGNKVNHGQSTVTVEGAAQTMPVKTAELEKAAEAQQVLDNLFEKYASAVETQDEAQTAYENIYKYASAAEDVLEANLGDGNYDGNDIVKVASALIESDVAEAMDVMEKEAAVIQFAELVSDLTLQKVAELVGQDTELEKSAELEKIAEEVTVQYLEKAADLLDQNGEPYNEFDVVQVADALLDADFQDAQ